VLDSFCIADRDPAGTDRHSGRVAYSPYLRYVALGCSAGGRIESEPLSNPQVLDGFAD
jgi:hypothetical protein